MLQIYSYLFYTWFLSRSFRSFFRTVIWTESSFQHDNSDYHYMGKKKVCSLVQDFWSRWFQVCLSGEVRWSVYVYVYVSFYNNGLSSYTKDIATATLLLRKEFFMGKRQHHQRVLESSFLRPFRTQKRLFCPHQLAKVSFIYSSNGMRVRWLLVACWLRCSFRFPNNLWVLPL